jgi:hypothetical protein
MPVLTANRVKGRQSDFSGGQNSSDEPASIGANQAVLLQNSIITKKGKVTQRNGITKLGGTYYSVDNLLTNSGFETWTGLTDLCVNGNMETGSPPSTWYKPPAMDSTWEREATIIKEGTYSGKLTRATEDAYVVQTITVSADTKTYIYGAWVYQAAGAGNRAAIYAGFTGGGNTGVKYHSGAAGWEYLSVSLANTNNTDLNVYLFLYNTAGSAYFDSVKVYEQLAPTGWTLAGTGATVAREEGTIKVGTYSAKLTRVSNDASIYQAIAAIVTGEVATYSCWVYATVASRARIGIVTDGTGTTYSSYHTGTAGWEYLTATATIGGTVSYVRAVNQVNTGDTTAYFDGASVIDITQSTILGITNFNAGSAYNYVLRAIGTSIQYLLSDFSGWSVITGLSALTDGISTNFVQALDKCFVLNGTDHVFSIANDLTVTDEADTNTDFPITTVAEWTPNNRMFASGSLTQATRDYVWFSNSIDPQTWDRATNVFKVRSGDGGKVTWLKAFKEFELIVYKNDSIHVLNMEGATPLTDWTLKPLSVAVGCPAGRTVQDIGNDHIFLANDGVRLLSRTTFDKLRVGVISDPIRDIIDSINQDAIETANGWFENGLYILNIPVGTSTTPNRTVIWDSVAAQRNGDPSSAWTTVPTDTWNISCMTSYGFSDNTKTVVGGSSAANSLCYKMLNGTTDDGTAIVQRIITRQNDFEEAFAKKIFDPSQFVAEGGSDGIYLIEMQVDEGGFVTVGQIALTGNLQTPFTTPASTVSLTNATGNFRTKFAGRGNYVQFRITNSVSGKIPTFIEYTTYARPYIGRI